MAVYQVGSGGKAPSGAQDGDYIITRNGAYVINGYKADGSPNGVLADGNINIYNYNNQYGSYSTVPTVSSGGTTSNRGSSVKTSGDSGFAASAGGSSISQAGNTMNWGGSGGTVTNSGQGTLSYNQDAQQLIRTMSNGSQWYVNQGDEKWPALYAEYLNSGAAKNDAIAGLGDVQTPTYQDPNAANQISQLQAQIAQMGNQQYTPVDQSQYTQNVMGYDDALQYASQLLAPKYDVATQQAVTNAAQNLDRAGIGNSLYGQQLSMQAETNMANQKQQAINELALSMVGKDREYAIQLLNLATNENQFGANYAQSGLSAAATASISLINALNTQAANLNNFNLEVQSNELMKRAQQIEALYMAKQIDNLDAETQLANLEIEATKAAAAAGLQLSGGYSGGSGGGSGSGGGYSGGSGSSGGGALPSIKDSLNNQATYSSSGGDIFYQVARNVRNMRDKGAADSVIGNYLADRIEDNSISSEQAQKILVSYGNILM